MSATVETVPSPYVIPHLASDRRSRARLRVAAVTVCAIAAGFAMSPYVALLRLGCALRCGDVETLATMVDWSSVRSGLRDELTQPAGPAVRNASISVVTTSSSDDLPDFGSSFASDAVSSALATEVTPSHVQALLRSSGGSGGNLLAEVAMLLEGASFHGMRHFDLSLPSPDRREAAIQVRLDFDAIHGWRVRRVSLPAGMLDDQSRT